MKKQPIPTGRDFKRRVNRRTGRQGVGKRKLRIRIRILFLTLHLGLVPSNGKCAKADGMVVSYRVAEHEDAHARQECNGGDDQSRAKLFGEFDQSA